MLNRYLKDLHRFIFPFFSLLLPFLAYTGEKVAHYTDENILALVSQLIPEKPNILEAGAHYGVDTIRMKYVWPKSTIYAFEPNPNTFSILEKVASRLKGVHCYELALSDYEGEISFHISVWDGASSLLECSEWHRWAYRDSPPISVRCTTLNQWARANQIPPIDFIWCDIEGAELMVLKHGLDVLKNVKAIYVEVNFKEYRQGMVQYCDLATFLNSVGFEQIYITPKTHYDSQANALFINKTFHP